MYSLLSQVVDLLAEGFDTHYGARSIKYEVERRVVTQLAVAHERQLISKGCRIKIAVNNPRSLVDDEKINEGNNEEKDEEKDEENNQEEPTIKLQILEEGGDNYKDLLVTDENPFSLND